MAPATVRGRLGVLAIALLAMSEPRLGQAASPSASANIQRARQHFLAGKHAFETESYGKALREFQAGYALEPRPGFLLNMGHAARRMGQLREARDYYQKFLATRPSPPADEQRAASKGIAEIDRELPSPSPGRAVAAGTPAPAAAVAVAPPAVIEPAAPVTPAIETPAVPASPPEAAASPEPPTASVVRPSGPRPTLFPGALRAAAPAPEPQAGLDPRPRSDALVTATSSPAPATASDAAPIYRRWWFWAGAGALAAGVVTAIAIGAQGGGPAARDSGSWGQIKL